MSVLQTVLLYGVVPLAAYLVIALLAAGRGLARRRPRYRPGEPWEFPPQWWGPNPEGAGLPDVSEHEPAGLADASRGGAHGTW